MDMYIKTKENNWLKCLKAYHSLYKIYSKNNHHIKQFRLDHSSWLQSYKADK